MILISAALVLAAIILLIAGVVLAKPFLVMWSIVISVLSAVCLLIGALLRRHELFPVGGRAAAEAAPTPQGSSVPQFAPAGTIPVGTAIGGTAGLPVAAPMPAPVAQPGVVGYPGVLATQPFTSQGGPPTAPVTRSPSLPGRGLGPDEIVLVIPGRRRFHRPACRQLAGREAEELTHEEARAEGFTPCTTCLPDLSVRAAEPDEEAAHREEGASGAATAAQSGPGASGDPETGSSAEDGQDGRQGAAADRTECAASGSDDTGNSRGPGEKDAGHDKRQSPAVAATAPAASGPSGPTAGSAAGTGSDPSGPDLDDTAEFAALKGVPLGGRGMGARRPGGPDAPGPQKAAGGDAGGKGGDDQKGRGLRSAVSSPSAPQDPSPAQRSETGKPKQRAGAASGGTAKSTGSDWFTPSRPKTRTEPTESETTAADAEPDATRPAGTAGDAPAAAGTTRAARPEPVEPAEIREPGRAGSSVPAGSTSGDPDAAPGQSPAERGPAEAKAGDAGSAEAEDSAEVYVMTGTRRYHDAGCVLITSVGASEIETMTRARAEADGLTPCPICRSG